MRVDRTIAEGAETGAEVDRARDTRRYDLIGRVLFEDEVVRD